MNNRGVTLIELMIVIAILGIAFNIKGFINIANNYKDQEKSIIEQEKILRFHKNLKNLLKDSKEFIKVTNKKLETDKFKLMISNNNDKIYLNGKVYNFKSFVMQNFRKSDDCVICDVLNGNQSFYLYLLPGKAEVSKTALKPDNSVENNEENENVDGNYVYEVEVEAQNE
ncbi:MAG: type II secretion system protein [Candidatus Riflebacteria bacterium]|nr:type II secretion system protein [Candidatus Riflebacteria bacterium]